MSTSLGDKIKLIRGTTGLNQIQFSELVGIGISSFKKYESGNRDVGAQSLLAIANHPQFKKYALWLVTGDTNPAAGQYAPGDITPESSSLSEEEFEEQFIDVAVGSLMMFCHLDWFKPNKDKNVDFNDCGKILLKDLRPVIEARANNSSSTQKMA
ncbi:MULTISPECIES: helix-turn-helix transcriptional regulator [unclassified Pseudoalteromonas]|uniref:helix-turn-helix domain-containing protein n=1 Tax=unclassified Pseudoalteromonas TaxID=194690 RepID=UPI001BB0FD7F|nr:MULTISPECIES: helix-turn-helix transcriptional regulator [unclassified Pseudoalteromonas]MCO7251346.1 helix-turn-helix domain-containing protein [Pseudoalteromonas sp. Ps84H-4]